MKEEKALRAKIFHYFAGEHSLTLLDSELEEVVGFFVEAESGDKKMMRTCEYCKADILTESDSFAWISTPAGHKISCIKCVEAKADQRKTEADDLEQLIKTFRHFHVNNGRDDSCRSCFLDLRNPIHSTGK